MTTIDIEKRFNFPAGMVFINADAGEGTYGVEVFDEEGGGLLSVELSTVEDRDNMFWFASAVLYQALLAGERDVSEEVLETLEKAFEDGDLSKDPRGAEGRFEVTHHPGLQTIQVEGYCVVKEEAMPEEWVADIAVIWLELASGRHYDLFPSRAHRLDPYGSTNKDFEDLKEDGRVPFRFQALEVDRLADFACNTYHPASWEELRGAKVIAVVPIVLDLKTRETRRIEQKDILDVGVSVGMEEWSFADVEWAYKELFDYHAREDAPTAEPFTLFELKADAETLTFEKTSFEATVTEEGGETYYESDLFRLAQRYPKKTRRRLYEPDDVTFLVSPWVQVSPDGGSVVTRFLVRGRYHDKDAVMKEILVYKTRKDVIALCDEYRALKYPDPEGREVAYRLLFRLNEELNVMHGKKV